MSKLARKPIIISEGVKIERKESELFFTGKEGNLTLPILPYLNLDIKPDSIMVTATAKHKQARANLGTMASLIKNAILGVSSGFLKTLEIEGIGFKVSLKGETLVLNVGFTHPVEFKTPENVKITVEKNIIKVSGVNKVLVGQTAAQIRKIKKPEPYKGKGIHYLGEVIRRKAGKKVAGTGAAS